MWEVGYIQLNLCGSLLYGAIDSFFHAVTSKLPLDVSYNKQSFKGIPPYT